MERSGGRRGWDAHNCRSTANGTNKAGPADIPGSRGLVADPSGHSEIVATPEPSGPQTAGAKK